MQKFVPLSPKCCGLAMLARPCIAETTKIKYMYTHSFRAERPEEVVFTEHFYEYNSISQKFVPLDQSVLYCLCWPGPAQQKYHKNQIRAQFQGRQTRGGLDIPSRIFVSSSFRCTIWGSKEPRQLCRSPCRMSRLTAIGAITLTYSSKLSHSSIENLSLQLCDDSASKKAFLKFKKNN